MRGGDYMERADMGKENDEQPAMIFVILYLGNMR